MVENSEESRTRDVAAYIDATSSFGLKLRIEIIGGNRIEVAVSSPRNLCFGDEEKMRFSGGEMVLHRMKIRTETANVAENYQKKVREFVRTPLRSAAKKEILPGGIFAPPPPRLGLRDMKCCATKSVASALSIRSGRASKEQVCTS